MKLFSILFTPEEKMFAGNRLPSAAALLVLTILGLAGCFCIWTSMGGSRTGMIFAMHQFMALSAGILLYLSVMRIPFRMLKDAALFPACCAVFLLILVLFAGEKVNGMRGWFRFGELLSFQPSEFAKPFFLLCLCRYASEKETDPKAYVRILTAGALFILPVILEPDLGSGTVFFAGLLCVLFTAGFPLKKILFPCACAVFVTEIYVLIHPYAMDRILGYLDPGADPGSAGWHIRQFQYTIARGGLFGNTSSDASWSEAYLPLAHSDSAFASIIESSGFTGGVIVIAGFLLLALIFRRMALDASGSCERIYIFSAGFLCVFQAFLHIGVNASMLPPTGLTLPIFSYGGSSLLGTMLLFAIASSARNAKQNISSG